MNSGLCPGCVLMLIHRRGAPQKDACAVGVNSWLGSIFPVVLLLRGLSSPECEKPGAVFTFPLGEAGETRCSSTSPE
eukprot:447294-Prorocentrum_lima.AAC.1